MRLLFIDKFEVGQPFFGREGQSEMMLSEDRIKSLKRLCCIHSLSFFSPYVDLFITSEQAQRLADKLVDHTEEGPNDEKMAELAAFLSTNSTRSGFFVFFSV